MPEVNWEKYSKYFKKSEFDCKHTGENHMTEDFMETIYFLRGLYDKPMAITSGYRSPSHPVEAAKKAPGEHTLGNAADIAVSADNVYQLVALAIKAGFNRIGVSQREGKARFVHLGIGGNGLPAPRIWSY